MERKHAVLAGAIFGFFISTLNPLDFKWGGANIHLGPVKGRISLNLDDYKLQNLPDWSQVKIPEFDSKKLEEAARKTIYGILPK